MARSVTASAAVAPAAPTLDRRPRGALLVLCGAPEIRRRLGLARPARPGESYPEATR
jgi:hypothetical protein